MYETGEDEMGPSLQMALQNRAEIEAREPREGPKCPPVLFVGRDGSDVAELNRLRATEADLLNEREALREKIRDLEASLRAARETRNEARDQNATYAAEIKELQSKLKISEGEVGDLHSHVDSVLKERDAARDEVESLRKRLLDCEATLHTTNKAYDEMRVEVAELTEKNKRFYIPSIREENMEKERDEARAEITKLMEQLAYQRDLRLHDVRVADGARDLAEKAGQEARRQLLAAQAEVASLQKELDEAKAELAQELGSIRQRFSAGSVLIDCGNALDAPPSGCRSREGLWFPDGKGTKLCYRCLVRQSQRRLEELQRAEKKGDELQEARNAAYIASLGPEQDLEDRVAELEKSLETLRNEVKGGRYG